MASCGCYDPVKVRAFAQGAYLAGLKLTPPAPPIPLLEAVLAGQFTTTIQSGGLQLISTTHEGQSVQFSAPEGLSSGDIMAYASSAIAWLLNQPDPTKPSFTDPRVKRLNLGFSIGAPT